MPVACVTAATALFKQLTGDGMPLWPALALAVIVGSEIAVLTGALRLRGGVVRLQDRSDVFRLLVDRRHAMVARSV